MTSTRERQQRAAARARLAREMAERQAAARRRRQRQAAIGAAAALVVIAGGVVWAMVALSGGDESESPSVALDPTPTVADGLCPWQPDDITGNPYLQEVGTPPVVEESLSGARTMTIATNHGDLTVEMDAEGAPCATTSFTFLAEQEFFDDTPCHRLVTDNIFVLQCGDPTGTGFGGPTYRYPEENLPTEVAEGPTYPKGTLAMAKSSAPNSTGSQFFIVYQDTELPPEYTIVGTVTEGIEIIEEIAAGGAVNPQSGETVTDGAPELEVTIETLRISDPA